MIKRFALTSFFILFVFIVLTFVIQNTSKKLLSDIKQERQNTAKTHALIEAMTGLENEQFSIDKRQEELKQVLGTKSDLQSRVKLLAEKNEATITLTFPSGGSDSSAKSTKAVLEVTAPSRDSVTRIATDLETGTPRIHVDKATLRPISNQFTLHIEATFYQP